MSGFNFATADELLVEVFKCGEAMDTQFKRYAELAHDLQAKRIDIPTFHERFKNALAKYEEAKQRYDDLHAWAERKGWFGRLGT